MKSCTGCFGPTPLGAVMVTLMAGLSGCTPPATGVAQIGAMRSVMRDGRTEARIGLTDAIAQPHAYAVGAIEGLRGEVTIADGAVWVTSVGVTGPSTTGPAPTPTAAATLLTRAHVRDWHDTIVDEPTGGAALESFIALAAEAARIDTALPFPFLIEGRPSELAIHVINGYCPMATDPRDIGVEPWRWSGSDIDAVTIVGFFARDAAGVMTHHGTSVHAHAIVTIDGETVTGHVDELEIGPGTTLRVPGSGWPHHR